MEKREKEGARVTRRPQTGGTEEGRQRNTRGGVEGVTTTVFEDAKWREGGKTTMGKEVGVEKLGAGDWGERHW